MQPPDTLTGEVPPAEVPTNGCPPPPSEPPPAPTKTVAPTPLSWRIGLAVALLVIYGVAALSQNVIGPRGQSLAGVLFFFGIVALFSSNLRAVNWRTIGWGVGLQTLLAVLVLWGQVTINGQKYTVYDGFEEAGELVKAFIAGSDKGAEFVFGNLAQPEVMAKRFGADYRFGFAFKALPPILVFSAFFAVLYHFGILQAIVHALALLMRRLMRTSGAETLSVAANVFMGQTEAPLIVKPYLAKMTRSELFTLMASGMAHISGGMMAVYISYGANPVAVLTTCVMACPCSLYLSKLFYPEIGQPETSAARMHKMKSPYVNAVDAAAAGTGDGLRLALNVAAMLIVFVAFVALIDSLLALVPTGGLDLPKGEHLSLAWIFGKLFTPVAMLMGVPGKDQAGVGELLGYKLALNEHVAYLRMKDWMTVPWHTALSMRSQHLAAYALTGFANFASVGIQIGGIGALAPERRHDLARLGMKALFVGFVATLLNASIAGLLSDLGG